MMPSRTLVMLAPAERSAGAPGTRRRSALRRRGRRRAGARLLRRPGRRHALQHGVRAGNLRHHHLEAQERHHHRSARRGRRCLRLRLPANAERLRDRAAGCCRRKLFQINYLDIERRGTSRTRVSSGQVGQGSGSGTGQNQNGQGGGESAQANSLSEPAGSVFSEGSGSAGRPRQGNHRHQHLDPLVVGFLVRPERQPAVDRRQRSRPPGGRQRAVGHHRGARHAARTARRPANSSTKSRISRPVRWCSKRRSSRSNCRMASRPASTGPLIGHNAGTTIGGFADRAAERLRQPRACSTSRRSRSPSDPGNTDRQRDHQHARRRLRARGQHNRLQCLHRAAQHAGQDARAVEPARLDAQQPEGRDQGRLPTSSS